jgi:xyloglucan:xyloglucosyl transferase
MAMARCSLLPILAAVLLAASLSLPPRAAAYAAMVDSLLPASATALSFEEGYTQLFGDSNLMLHGDGKRVHISLDERTGRSCISRIDAMANGSLCSCRVSPCWRSVSGAGFASQGAYHHGFFSASIKLPADHTAGVVVAFYVSITNSLRTNRCKCAMRQEILILKLALDSLGLSRCMVVTALSFWPQMSNGDVYERTHDELDFEFLGNVRGREWRVQTNVYGNGSTAAGREERYGLWFDPTQDFHRYAIRWSHDTIM